VIAHGVDDVAPRSGVRPVGVVGFVGRLVSAKGVDDLAVALEHRTDLKLRVAGDGPRRDAFAILRSRVEMLGSLSASDMDAFYDSISVLAVPSRTTPTWSEQFGRVLVEAQAREVPVVAYASGEIPWVASRTGAILVPEGDVVALGKQIELLARDVDLACELGRQGRLGVESSFTNSIAAEQLASAITTVLAPPQ
jgi:glycosyltransferase involved in cell wall biosynthesis